MALSHRTPASRKPEAEFRCGIESDSQENTKLMLAYAKKILEKLGASLEPPYNALSGVLAVAHRRNSSWAIVLQISRKWI